MAWEVKKKVRERFEEVCNAEQVEELDLSWSTKMTRTWGMYKWRYKWVDGVREVYDRHIVLSERLTRHSLQVAMETMLHEVAHYLDDLLHDGPDKRRSHGPSFHRINDRLGGSYKGRASDGSRVHVAAETSGRQVVYQCKHGHEIVRTRRIKTAGRYIRRCRCWLDDCEVFIR